jgi:hypothetical protein
MSFVSPFDLYTIFVLWFAGNTTIFLAIAFAVIAAMSAMFRMPNLMTGVMFLLFILMIGILAGNIYILAILILAIVVGWTISRLFKG